MFWLPQTLTALLGFLPAIIASILDSLDLVGVIEKVGAVRFAKLSLWLLAFLLWSLAFYLLKRPKYQFLAELGIRGNVKKQYYLCPSCNKLLRVEMKGLHCMACDKFIPLPDREIMRLILDK